MYGVTEPSSLFEVEALPTPTSSGVDASTFIGNITVFWPTLGRVNAVGLLKFEITGAVWEPEVLLLVAFCLSSDKPTPKVAWVGGEELELA